MPGWLSLIPETAISYYLKMFNKILFMFYKIYQFYDPIRWYKPCKTPHLTSVWINISTMKMLDKVNLMTRWLILSKDGRDTTSHWKKLTLKSESAFDKLQVWEISDVKSFFHGHTRSYKTVMNLKRLLILREHYITSYLR